MVPRLLSLCGVVAGCSFSAKSAGQTGGDAPTGVDSPMQMIDARAIDAAPDAPPDAPRDAKVWMDAPPVTGSLSVVLSQVPNGDVNLTSEGTRDWTHWGYGGATGFDHKNGANLISDTTVAGGSKLAIGSISETASWSDGTPQMAVSMTGTGVGVTAGSSLTITVPAGTTPQTLHFYCGNKYSTAKLDVSLSDSSATAFSDMQTAGSTSLHEEYTIVFNAASAGQTLTVTWSDTTDSVNGGFAMAISATLP